MMNQNLSKYLENEKIFVVVPMYRVAPYIQDVIAEIPDWIQHIVVVNDASPDNCVEKVKLINDPRVLILEHEENQGVGGAMITGYEAAVAAGATIMVKMDGDGQMSPDYLEDIVQPIIEGKADYVKGNRFFHLSQIVQMPAARRFGNMGLSFLTKLVSGYWNIFDPTNGYTALSADAYRLIDKEHIHKRYFFETSMLIELRLVRSVVMDVPIPARYQGEESSLSVFKALREFPFFLIVGLLRRVWLQYFVMDFSAGSLFLVVGIILCAFGSLWGSYAWAKSHFTNITASTGSVMIAVLPFILGFQLILQAIIFDVQNIPTVSRFCHSRNRQ